MPPLHFRSILTFVVLLLPTFCAAQPAATGEVSGTIVDALTGEPVAGASVSLIWPGDKEVMVVGTDGSFIFRGLPAGSYTVLAASVGYAAAEQRFTLADGERARVRLALEEEVVKLGDEIVVTATRARERLTPVTFSNITAEELEQQADMKDLPVLLATLPSVTYHSENGNGIGYSTLRMRGFDQRRVAVSINGIPQNDPEDFNVFWINFFDVQGAIRDIQVQRGAGASFYGPDAIGGAINIETWPYPGEPSLAVEVGAGAYGTRRYTAEVGSGRLGRYELFGRYSRLLSDGYRDWSWTEFHRFFGGIVRHGDRHRLTLQAAGGPQRDGLAFSGIAKAANENDSLRRANFSALTEDIERFHQPRIELLHDWTPNARMHARQAFFLTKGEGYFDFGAAFRSPDYLRLPDGWRGLDPAQRRLPLFLTAPDVGVLFRAYLDQWQVGWMPRLTFLDGRQETTLGAELRLHRSERWGRIQEAGAHPDSTGIPAPFIGSDHNARVYQYHGEKVITSIFASHRARPLERLAVQADVQLTYRRYRHYDEQFFGNAFSVPYLFLNPRLGLTLNPEQPLSGYFSVALASREPRLKSLYDGEEAGMGFAPQFRQSGPGLYDFSDPLVKPERLLDVETGFALLRPFTYEQGGIVRPQGVKANVFWMEFQDEIVPSGGLDQFGVPRSRNAERSRHMGLEVEASIPLQQWIGGPEPFAWWIEGNLTLSRNRYIRFTEFTPAPLVRDDNPIAGFPERLANLALVVQKGDRFSLRADAAFVGKQYIDNSAARRADGTYDPALVVDPYTLVNASVRYVVGGSGWSQGLSLSLDANNVFDRKALLYGNVGPAGPQFFPAATRHIFVGLRYER